VNPRPRKERLVTGIPLGEQLRRQVPLFVTLVGLGLLWTFGINGLWERLQIDLDGTIIAREDHPPSPHTHGPTTAYMLRRADGSLGDYVATANDPSLPRTLPIGTHVTKRRWELSYRQNDERIDDFPQFAYVGFIIAGIACSLIGAVMLKRRWPLVM
jgi:hypothetical protein